MCAGNGVLAVQENFGHITECGCGTVHVTVGPVTLALDSQALRHLHELVGAAITQQEAAVEELILPKHSLVRSSHLAMRKVLKIKH